MSNAEIVTHSSCFFFVAIFNPIALSVNNLSVFNKRQGVPFDIFVKTHQVA